MKAFSYCLAKLIKLINLREDAKVVSYEKLKYLLIAIKEATIQVSSVSDLPDTTHLVPLNPNEDEAMHQTDSECP